MAKHGLRPVFFTVNREKGLRLAVGWMVECNSRFGDLVEVFCFKPSGYGSDGPEYSGIFASSGWFVSGAAQ